MAGVHFKYSDLKQLIELNIGITSRLDENRAESLTILYCDLTDHKGKDIKSSIENVLRHSDSVVNSQKDYFFLLPYTDKYGAGVVKAMFDKFFKQDISSYMVSYPKDGENSDEIIESLQVGVKKYCKKDISYLYELISK
ncbi:hypothetical protein [Sulfurimonas sp.]|uniref:hypothetical protein n=1 Tax=Sulfurimonas sp. TaxID=2022749 RepID=UPI0035616485